MQFKRESGFIWSTAFRLVLFTCMSYLCVPLGLAQDQRTWVEVGTTGYQGLLQLKHFDGRRGWTGFITEINQIDEFDSWIAPESIVDSITGETVQPSVNIAGIMRSWSRYGSWYHLDAGIGLGLSVGEWGENCVDEFRFLFDFTRNCDVKKLQAMGIPIQFTVSLGKYAGLSVGLIGFFADYAQHGILNLSIPIGRYPE